MSPMDMYRSTETDRAEIEITKNVSKPDPRDSENVIRVIEKEVFMQDPAMMCTGCYEDATTVPTAPPIYVGGNKK